MPDVKIEKQNCPGLWVVRNGYDWCFFVVCEKTGLVSAHGSYGTFAYIWPPCNIGTKTVAEFIAGVNFGYAMGKFLGGPKDVNYEETIRCVKRWIIEDRQVGGLDSETARSMWDEVLDLDHDDRFGWQLRDTEYAAHFGDWYVCFRYEYPVEARGFWEQLWEPFVAHLVAREENGHE